MLNLSTNFLFASNGLTFLHDVHVFIVEFMSEELISVNFSIAYFAVRGFPQFDGVAIVFNNNH